MKHRNGMLYLLIFTFIFSFIMCDYAVATSRNELLSNFLQSNQTSAGSFVDSPEDSITTATEFSTFANVYLLSELGQLDQIDTTKAEAWAVNQFEFETYDYDKIAETYFAYKICKELDYDVNSSIEDIAVTTIFTFENSTTHGFQNGQSQIATIADTFYAVEFLYEIGASGFNLLNADNLANFVISCWDASANAFAGSPNGIVNPIDSYFAVKTLERLDKLSMLDNDKKSGLSTYIDNYYVDDGSSYPTHYGGYSYIALNPQSSIALTFYCVGTQKVIDGTTHSQTTEWLLNRQSSDDFGFQDVTDPANTGDSSSILSYYAISTILALDSGALEGSLNDELWNLSVNPWIVALIVVIIIAVLVLAGFGIYKYKNRV